MSEFLASKHIGESEYVKKRVECLLADSSSDVTKEEAEQMASYEFRRLDARANFRIEDPFDCYVTSEEKTLRKGSKEILDCYAPRTPSTVAASGAPHRESSVGRILFPFRSPVQPSPRSSPDSSPLPAPSPTSSRTTRSARRLSRLAGAGAFFRRVSAGRSGRSP